jgi:hypothetical protein
MGVSWRKFVMARQNAGRLTCDTCNFDPMASWPAFDP